jgi:hypothetical protein
MHITKTAAIFFLMIFVTPFSGVYAQQFGGGLVAGVNFSQVDGDQFGGYNKPGLCVGLSVNRKHGDHWTFQGELLYNQKGSRKPIDPDDPNPLIFILRLNYLEMPLLARYRTGDFSFEAGPSFGVLVAAKKDLNLGFQPEPGINPTELSMNIGVSYHFNEQWAFLLRHNSSLLRIGNPYTGGIYLFTRNGLYSRLFNLSIRYSFD